MEDQSTECAEDDSRQQPWRAALLLPDYLRLTKLEWYTGVLGTDT